jgi:NAD(P)-dependent dehydrogenase (short-subunit alcohol dehydrogenase family)
MMHACGNRRYTAMQGYKGVKPAMKYAIITGASVGIGRATAETFLAGGYTVYNLSRRACPTAGVINLHCDLASSGSIEAACETLAAGMDNCESVALVHNASQMRKDSTRACASDSLRDVLETNVVAINGLNQRLLPLLPRGSSVLYVGSTLAEKAVPNSFSYVVSKHAQLGIMRASYQDLMGSGVHTALICPGFTDTEMLRTHIGNDPAAVNTIAAMNSYNRLIAPTEIAELIHWAHHNPVINGAVLHANLGQREA